MKTLLPLILAAVPIFASAATPATCSVRIDNDPVVIRMDKDEFRIAFGVTSKECRESGCAGVIRYQAAWRTDDGLERTEDKVLDYEIPSGANRSIVVDRNFFDTSEGRHTTDIVGVRVGDVSCQKPRLTAGR